MEDLILDDEEIRGINLKPEHVLIIGKIIELGTGETRSYDKVLGAIAYAGSLITEDDRNELMKYLDAQGGDECDCPKCSARRNPH